MSLGERHPYFALALAGWGMQYHWAGKDVIAEELLKQAIEISKESLGPLHPDHALILSSLGRVYRDSWASSISRNSSWRKRPESMLEMFGPRSYRYSSTLRELAVAATGYWAVSAKPRPCSARPWTLAWTPRRMNAADALSALLASSKHAWASSRRRRPCWARRKRRSRRRPTERCRGYRCSSRNRLHVNLADVKVRRGWLFLRSGHEDDSPTACAARHL